MSWQLSVRAAVKDDEKDAAVVAGREEKAMRRWPRPNDYAPGDVCSFGELCPDLANRELLQLFITQKHALPQGHYAFLEFYCPDPACDCQVVMWRVIARPLQAGAFPTAPVPLATFSWCWAEDDPRGPQEPEEEPAPQSPLAPLLLAQVKSAIYESGYGERIRAHYAAVRAEGRRPGSSVYRLLHSGR